MLPKQNRIQKTGFFSSFLSSPGFTRAHTATSSAFDTLSARVSLHSVAIILLALAFFSAVFAKDIPNVNAEFGIKNMQNDSLLSDNFLTNVECTDGDCHVVLVTISECMYQFKKPVIRHHKAQNPVWDSESQRITFQLETDDGQETWILILSPEENGSRRILDFKAEGQDYQRVPLKQELKALVKKELQLDCKVELPILPGNTHKPGNVKF